MAKNNLTLSSAHRSEENTRSGNFPYSELHIVPQDQVRSGRSEVYYRDGAGMEVRIVVE